MTLIRTLFNSIKTNKNIIYNFLYFILIFFLLMCSGNGIVLFEFSSKLRMILYIIIGLISLFIFIMPIKPKKVIEDLKNKTLPNKSIPFLFGTIFLIFVLISFLLNREKSLNMNTYLDIAFVVIVSLLLTSRISYKKISKYLNYTLLFISLISLFLYLMVYFGKYDFSTSSFLNGTQQYDNYGFLNLFYNEKMHGIGGSPRFCSIFWEPGVYATFLIIGCINELLFKKTNFFNIVVFCFCLILTKSTASYMLFPFVVILAIATKIKRQKLKNVLLGVSYFLIIAVFLLLVFRSDFLIKAFPSIFGKFFGSVSLTSRLLSPYFYLKVFCSNFKTILFGMGGVSANKLYYVLAESTNGLIDSGTSTSGYLLASFGFTGILFTILPIIGIFFNKKWTFSIKISLLIIFICIFNKENHGSILYSMIIIFSLIHLIPKIKTKKGYSYNLFSSNKSIKDIIMGKNDDGTFSRNILGSLIIKILAVVVSILTIPVYTSFFKNSHNLDVWLVIYSVLGWILLFDFGFGNGMKNKLIYAFSKKDNQKAHSIISNTYVPTCFISLAILITLILLCSFTNVNSVFGDANNEITTAELKTALIIISASVCLQFVLRNIGFIYQAKNRNVLGTSFSLISSSMFISLLFLIKNVSGPKFIYIAIGYFVSINLPLLIANISFFNKNRELRPSFKLYSFQNCKEVMSLGIQYFLVQLCSLILISSNALLITHLFDPDSTKRYVYYYTCYYKIYSTIASLISIISATVWVAAGKSYIRHDNKLLKKLIKISSLYSTLLCFGTILCSLILQFVFNLWLGESPESYIKADLFTIIIFALFGMLTILSETLIIFCNAFSRIKKQVIISIVFAAGKIPLLFLLNKLNVLGNIWQVVVIYNLLYLLTMSVVLFFDLFIFIKKEIKTYGYKSSEEENESTNNKKEIMVYEVKI